MFGWDKKNYNGLNIAIPIHPSSRVADIFYERLEQAQKPKNTIITKEAQFGIDHARNILAEKFLMTDCKFILFLDSDILLNQDTIMKLINAYEETGYRCITAVYHEKRGMIEPAIWHHSGVPTQRGASYKVTELPSEIELCGMGCCLIHRDIFEQTEYPWFRYTLNTLELPDDERISEDFYFCYKKVYKEFGERPYAIPEIVGHLGRVIVKSPQEMILI